MLPNSRAADSERFRQTAFARQSLTLRECSIQNSLPDLRFDLLTWPCHSCRAKFPTRIERGIACEVRCHTNTLLVNV